MKKPSIQVLLTGNELMAGDIVDSNSAMIAQQLNEYGLSIARKVTLGDDLALLVNELKHMASQADILIVNGGLGPTVDDLTALALSKAMATELAEHPEALSQLTTWCQQRGSELNQANLKQALLPKGSTVIKNHSGSAPGFLCQLLGCQVYCTPGVPHELETMLAKEILPQISQQYSLQADKQTIKMQVFGLGEAKLQQMIDDNLSHWPQDIELGFRAGTPLLEVKLTSKTKIAQNSLNHWQQRLISLLSTHYVATIDDKPLELAEHVLSLLQQQNLTITTAESCTGGLIASKLTEISGSSQSFEAGFVTYSNNMKTAMISVPEALLIEHGAVSEPVALAMAKGALAKAKADMVIAVTGIAGPSGGSAEKPNGTVWLAWGTANNVQTLCLLLPFKRKYFQHYVANIALDLIRRQLIQSKETPNYVKERAFEPIKRK